MRFQKIDISRQYYFIKPLIPRWLQILVRSWTAARTRRFCKERWPIDRTASMMPHGWRGWPDKKRFALVLTHDVETPRGQQKCHRLMKLEESLGFRSSFNFVAAGYPDAHDLRSHLTENGFEVGVHGLVHNRALYASRTAFREQATRINDYLQRWKSVGFRSPCMYHNLEWLRDLDIAYDASTFDTDPFEPQSDGVGTIFPFYVQGRSGRNGYVELPYTLPQDFTLFVLLQERNISIWKEKLAWIAECGGMALLNTHPDYMHFGRRAKSYEEYPADYYEELLTYVKEHYTGSYWHVLPKDLACFWTKNFSGEVLRQEEDL